MAIVHPMMAAHFEDIDDQVDLHLKA